MVATQNQVSTAPAQSVFKVPLLDRLQKLDCPGLSGSIAAAVVQSLDSNAMLFFEIIVRDLSQANETSRDLKLQVANLAATLQAERSTLEELKIENAKLQEENCSLRGEVQRCQRSRCLDKKPSTIDRETGESVEDQVHLWRVQSMHKLQELERMNEALRSTLNLHSCCFGPDGEEKRDSHRGRRIELSKVLEPRTTQIVRGLEGTLQEEESSKQQKVDLLEISERKCKCFEGELQCLKEKHDALADMLAVAQAEIHKLEAQVQKQESLMVTLQSELSQKNDRLNFITDEKVVGEEALEASQLECSQLTALIKELDQNMVRLTTALTTRTVERDTAICAEKKEAEAKFLVEEGLQKKCNGLVSKLEEAEAEKLQLQGDIERLQSSQEEENIKNAETRAKLQKTQKQLEEARTDVEQLKALVTQLDLTREELVEKLKSTLSNQRLVENQLAVLEMELQRLAEELHIHKIEIAQSHEVIESLGKERDHVLSQLELHIQKIGQLKAENDTLANDSMFLKREIQNAEQKVQAGKIQLHQSEVKIASLKEQVLVEEEARTALEGRFATKSDELQAIVEDCAKKGLEQQLIKKELQQVSAERASLIEELRSAASKLSFSHQIIYARENEEKEIRNSYQKLCEEHQQLKQAAFELDAQAQQQRFQLQSMEELLHRTQEQAKCLEGEAKKSTDDIKGLERQADIMARSLSQQSAILDDYHKEKSLLLSQLSASKQTTINLEQRQESVLREMKAMQAKNQILTGVLEEKMQESEALTTRYRLEHEHVKELEQLLACVRAQEHQLELENKDKGTKYVMMREQLLSLEHQVHTLQVTRDAQNQEIMRLQNLLQNKDQMDTSKTLSAGVSTLPLQLKEPNCPSSIHNPGLSKVKVQELEMRNISLAEDLAKTASSYKDCLARLQKADAKFAEQKENYDHVLLLLSKVDEERTQLQKKCRELLAEADSIEPCVNIEDHKLINGLKQEVSKGIQTTSNS
ncbi:hypothetical protein O6H91_03G059900 [Diphasiastrum complanatum]|uniref:Uncharacterized protein n=1 Tax=Diphasiastrum complanatum TaxID=34168 RepID=A0ACC2E6W0_DIPCM|nr:hypothetical protein O6H91_03G059900 [Diphasiastrum complanatum]